MNKGVIQGIDQGFNPTTGDWIVYAPTITGFSSIASSVFKYKIIGNSIFCYVYISGTSNATTFTYTLPYTPKRQGSGLITQWTLLGDVISVNNGATIANGRVDIVATSTSVVLYATAGGGTWTNSGTKGTNMIFYYNIF